MPQTADRDALAVTARLREAVAGSGLTQAGFARALGTSASRFSTYLSGTTKPSAQLFLRAERLAGALRRADAQGLMTAPGTALALRDELHRDDLAWTWRMLLQGRDHLRLMLAGSDEELLGSWEAAPGRTGSVGFDALLAALAGNEFEVAGLSAPAWTHTSPLDPPWSPEHPFLSPARVAAQAPEWLRALNIFVPERDLVTA
ncbi:MAG: helix-turn-helix transcriptional regulator [Frankiaceae bacterium]|nr:helix-turn-helix transcriptional regulator [Frankiaceae bacterium]